MSRLQMAKLALHRPRNLAALIDMYEGNYFRLMRLVPELDQMRGTLVSRVQGSLDLYLTVLERFPYTSTIALTYRFDDPDGPIAEPNVRVCIYHDVKAVDVISHSSRRLRLVRPWRRGHMPELERKWRLNRFLQKWLGFCLRQGHLFLRCTAIPVDSLPGGSLVGVDPRALQLAGDGEGRSRPGPGGFVTAPDGSNPWGE